MMNGKKIIHNAEGGNAMTVFNYGFANDMTTHMEIEDDTLKCKFTKVTDVIFRDFPMLRIDDLVLENCVFENCHTVYFSDCKVSGCQFFGIDTLYADRSPISGCEFEHLRCHNHSVLCLEDSEVSYCTFRDAELTNEAHLISGVGDVWVESCSFENIRTDRKDRELFFCEETVGKIFKKKVQFCIADTASCKGLDGIKYTVDEKTPDNPEGDLWVQAMQRGIAVEKAMAAMREGISWDESKWDARTLGLVLGDLIVKIPVYNCLTRAGLRTVGDLVRLDYRQILAIRNLGKTVVEEVVELLHSLNITGSAWDYLC